MNALVQSVNVGAVRTVRYGNQSITTGIFKEPVSGPVAVRGVNLRGDDQADREAHGGDVRAVYAYAREDYLWWERELERPMPPGEFGENLTTGGIDVNQALIGERWRVGTALLQITVPRVPCYKLAMKMNDPRFIKRFAQALRPGAYLSIVEEGEIERGSRVQIAQRPAHGVTIAEMTKIYLFERHRLRELLVPELHPSWRDWVLAQI